jgi:hypothetical protein
VYKNKTDDDTVDSFTNIILQAVDSEISWNTISKPKFPHWFAPMLKYYIRKKNGVYTRYRKHKLEQYYSKFSYCQKLVKITMKSDRFNWYKSIDNGLKTQLPKFWKYVFSSRKHNSHGVYVVIPHEVAEVFAEHFQSVYQTFPLNSCHCGSLSNE